MSLQILESGRHPRESVDPFGQLPCKHAQVVVHITNGESIGDDILECKACDCVVTLRDLYAAVRMPNPMDPKA